MGAPGTHRGEARPGLATLRQAFARASQRASGPGSEEDPGLLRRSSRFLLRSWRRRAPNDSPAAEQCQATAAPGVTDGVGRQLSTGAGPEEPEPEAGESFTNSTKPGGDRGQGLARENSRLPTGSAHQRPQSLPATQLRFKFIQHLSKGALAGRVRKVRLREVKCLASSFTVESGGMGFESVLAWVQSPGLSTALRSLVPA